MVWLERSSKYHTEDIKAQAVNMERKEAFHRTLASEQNSRHVHQTSCTCLHKITSMTVPSKDEQMGECHRTLTRESQYSLLPLPAIFYVILHTASRSQVSLEHIL